MKHLKRLLCAVLCLALCCAMGVFAVAEDEVDPYAPVITKQPKEFSSVRAGKSTTLEVQACLPDGVDGMLSYAWYEKMDPTQPLSTSANAEISTLPEDLGTSYADNKYYCVVVTNTFIDEEGQERTASATSKTARVFIHLGAGDLLATHWNDFVGRPLEKPSETPIIVRVLMGFPAFLGAAILDLLFLIPFISLYSLFL